MKNHLNFQVRWVCAALNLVLTFAVALHAQTPPRIVAIGDVHGAYLQFVAILQRTGLIDSNRQWIAGAAVFVQTGDVPDRGGQTREVLDLLMELERQAEKQNGKVIPLLGNHEVMNMMGDLRYVSPDDYQRFATDKSEKVREDAYKDYRKFLAAQSGEHHTVPPDDEATRQKWMAEHPLGFFERYDAFSPQGLYGGWFRKHDAVAQLDDALFMHGGLDPKLHFHNIRELNDRVHSELASFDDIWQLLSERKIIWRYMKLEEAIRQAQEEWNAIQARGSIEDREAAQDIQKLLGLQSWLIVSPDGPLWYRGLALEPEENLKRDVNGMLKKLKVRYIVAGHTVRPKFDIMPRFENHVFLIDTGMLKGVYGGRASALELRNGQFTAYYADGPQEVLLGPQGGVAASPGDGHDGGDRKP